MSLGPKNMSATFAEDARGKKGGCKYMYPKSSKPPTTLALDIFVVFGAPLTRPNSPQEVVSLWGVLKNSHPHVRYVGD